MKYIILSIILLYLLFIMYCKVRFRFWSIQPVFHIHNLYYWIFPCGIIDSKLPPITKFYDPLVEFCTFKALSKANRENLYCLNRNNYLTDTHIKYLPTRNSIFSYFKKHNNPCFIALLFKDNPLFNVKKKTLIPHRRCIGSITSRPLSVSLHKNKIDVNYVDYLCVDKKNRKQGIAPKLIYSYYVHSRQKYKTLVCLFKREGVGTFITPMTVYLTYGFHFRNKSLKANHFSPILINASTFSLFYHYSQTFDFPCFVHPDFSHLQYLVEQKLIYIFLLVENDEPWACYIFRNPHTKYENTGMSVDCIASYCSYPERKDEFSRQFYFCLPQIDTPFDYLLIENISHNHYIIKNLLKEHSPFLKSKTSYYLYNFAYRPFLSKDVFILS